MTTVIYGRDVEGFLDRVLFKSGVAKFNVRLKPSKCFWNDSIEFLGHVLVDKNGEKMSRFIIYLV